MPFNKKEYDADYEKEHTFRIFLKFNRKIDSDIYEWISTKKNRQGYIKKLIREDIARAAKKADSSR